MRKLQFKFPNQIRISGWDFGSSARAMNQAGGFISTQADLEKVSRSTTERKSMSTKTTIKRIALVAVSALGLGLLSVVPSSAAVGRQTPSSISLGTATPARVGIATTVPLTFGFAAALVDNDTMTVHAKVLTAPSTSRHISVSSHIGNTIAGSSPSQTGNLRFNGAASTNTDGATNTDRSAAASTGETATAVSAVVVNNAQTGLSWTGTNLSFVPDVAGTYTILVSATRDDAVTSWTAGLPSVVWTVTTVGAPSSITVASYGGVAATSGVNGQLFSISLKDAAGSATVLGSGEGLTLTSSDSTNITLKGYAGDSSNGSAITALGASDSNLVNGVYYVRAIGGSGAADGTALLTVTGNGTIPTSVTATATITEVTATAAASASTITVACTTSTQCPSNKISGAGVSVTIGALNTGSTTADVVHPVELTDKFGFKYTSTITLAKAATAATSAKITSPSVDSTYTTAKVKAGAVELTLTYEKPAISTIAVVGASTVLSATAGTTTWNVISKDQYGKAIQYNPVEVAVSGRNTVAKRSLGVSDANGIVSYTLTDAGTAGTVDTLTFTSTGASSVSGTVNYGAISVNTVTVKGGNNTTTGVAATTTQWKDINAGIDGASATTHDVVATVKDASGNLVAGVPVTFTVSGTTAAITSTTKTVYTNSVGTATAQVYAWAAGKYTVTATAGGKTGTADYEFRQSASGEERTISASVSGNIVTAKAVDRFGNVVPDVTIYATQTGGVTINSKTRDSGTTDATGTVDFIISGTGTVTVSTISWTSAAGTYGSGQTSAPKGYVANASTAAALALNAFTASAAGTTTADEEGVGASFDAAGVATASVDVTTTGSSDAVDAANDAVEAANAATDAANAAAEAADAATAAAQDAQAAVADLAAQVATLISGIKAQITRLTNLVVKIQKKVNA